MIEVNMPAYKYQNTAGKTLWYTSFYYTDWNGTKKRTTKRGFATKRDALQYERTFLSNLHMEPTIEFKHMINDYLEDCTLRLKPTTTRTRKVLINSKFLPYFGEMRICDIDVNTIRAWQNEMIQYRDENGRPYKETYLRTLNRELSNIMTFCVKYYQLSGNPCRLIKPMGKYQAEEMKIWTKDQFEIFMQHEYKTSYHAAFNVLFYAGLREGELLALTPNDLIDETCALSISKNFANVNGNDLMLTPKTESSKRIVTLPKSVYEELKQYVKDMDCAPDQRIFYFKRGGLWNEFRRCTADAKLPLIRIHDLRHSHVSMLIDMGFNFKQIADRVGHKNATTTVRIYSHLYSGRDIELAERLEEEMNGINPQDEGKKPESPKNAKNDC